MDGKKTENGIKGGVTNLTNSSNRACRIVVASTVSAPSRSSNNLHAIPRFTNAGIAPRQPAAEV